jgi:Tfp pilus assembly PilM family ATPase
VAIPRNTIAPYVELLMQSRIEPVGIDLAEISVLKLAAMQGVNFSDGITLLLNFNMQSSDLLLLENDTLQLVRKVGQGKQQLREVFARTLPPESGARDGITKLDFRVPSEYTRLAGDYVSALLGEIRRSIEFYLTEMKRAEGNVSKVVLAGSGYWPVNLPEVLEQQLHLPLIDLSFDRLPNVVCDTGFSPNFPALGVYAPVVGSVLAGVS